MDILPAIDLLGGRCVRLMQGRYDRLIEYERDPLDVAQQFRQAGATWSHVVDLDGARNGRIENFDVLRAIVRDTGLRVQFGGGIRDEAAIDGALAAGAERVIVGTRALEDWAWFEHIVHRRDYVNRIALGLDARLGCLAVRGWTLDTHQVATEVAQAASDWPLACIVYTDIGHDGLLLGPNFEAIERMRAFATVPVISAGGVSDADDIQRLRSIGIEGVVIGRAIYENRLSVEGALAAARNDNR